MGESPKVRRVVGEQRADTMRLHRRDNVGVINLPAGGWNTFQQTQQVIDYLVTLWNNFKRLAESANTFEYVL